MIVLLHGEPGWNRWPPIRKVFDVLTRHDTVVYDGARGLGSMAEFYVMTLKATKRPTMELHRAEWPKYPEDADTRRNQRMVLVGNPSAIVLFRDGPDGGADDLIAVAEKVPQRITVYEWEDFVETMQR